MKQIVKLLFCALLYCFFFNFAQAQIYSEPSGTLWNQIKTEHFKIVYPRKIDSMALRYAKILERTYNHVSQSLNGNVKGPVSLVLHPNDLNSNAWVSYAPRQMDFITAPNLGMFSTSWDKSLALHEFRHYVQLSKQKQAGIMKYTQYLFGDYNAVAWALFVPTWFLEGDAVSSETSMSKSGRGRNPAFLAEYRAYLMNGFNFSYDKWMQGSYKNYIPNIYSFGYTQVAFARTLFGEDVWEKTINRFLTKSFPLFNKAFRKISDISLKALNEKSFDDIKNTYEKENRKVDENVKYLTEEKSDYVRYLYPYSIENKCIVALKESLGNIPCLVIINNNVEKYLTDIGYYEDRIFYNKNCVYWIENISDLRWTAKSANSIKCFDLISKKKRTIKSKTRFRTLAFSDNICAAAYLSRGGDNLLYVLNSKDFSEIFKIPTPNNSTIVSLTINAGSNLVAASLLDDNGVSLRIFDIGKKSWKTVIENAHSSIENLTFAGNKILFNSGFDGIDNLYSVSDSGKIFKISNSAFGAICPSVKNDSIICSEFYFNGTKISLRITKKMEQQLVDWNNPYKFGRAETLALQENFLVDTINLSDSVQHLIKPYSKIGNLFRVRTWLPFYAGLNYDEKTDLNDFFYRENDDDNKFSAGASIISQNLLMNTKMQLAYSYKGGYSSVHAGLSCSSFFPVFNIYAHYGGGKNVLVDLEKKFLVPGNSNRFNVETEMYIPLNFSDALYFRGIYPRVKFSVNNTKFIAPNNAEKLMNTAEYSLFAYTYMKKSKRDIFPKFGAFAEINMNNSPFNSKNFGTIWGGRVGVYLPGLFNNNGLRISALYQKQNVKRFYFLTLYDFPREMHNDVSEKLYMFTSDYSFPVFYPDLEIGGILYTTRVRGNVFVDYGFNKNRMRGKYSVCSYGLDCIFDTFILRSQYPVSLGLRLYKAKYTDDYGFKFILGISF